MYYMETIDRCSVSLYDQFFLKINVSGNQAYEIMLNYYSMILAAP
jgi:hypothetical protein